MILIQTILSIIPTIRILYISPKTLIKNPIQTTHPATLSINVQ